MIMDLIENAEYYYGISAEIKSALDFLKETDVENVPVGRYDILEDKVFALVQEYKPGDISEYELESHKKYIDVQFIVRGKESIAYSNIKSLHISKKYDEESDYQLLKGPSNILTAKENSFFIFMPEDAHKPGIRLEDCLNVKKIVVKVLIWKLFPNLHDAYKHMAPTLYIIKPYNLIYMEDKLWLIKIQLYQDMSN